MPDILTAMEIKDVLVPILQSHNITEARLFGSYAKGCATPYSDVDVYVVSDLQGLYYFGLRGEMIDALGKDVDLVSSNLVALDSDLRKSIEKTGVDIFRLTPDHVTSNGVTREILCKHDTKYLKDLWARCSRIAEIRAKTPTFEEFMQDQFAPDAATYNLCIMETIATVFISPEAKSELPGIPWKELEHLESQFKLPMCEINYTEVWRISCNIIPGVQQTLQEYLQL